MRPEHNEGIPLVPQILTNRAEDFIWAWGDEPRLPGGELKLGCPSGTVVSSTRASFWPGRRR